MSRLTAALLLAAATLLFHARVLFTATHAFPWDLRHYHLPLAAALADSIAGFEFPYWEPYSYCGRPLAANPQAAAFYPTVVLASALGREGLLERLEWNIALHIWLAAWLAYRLAHRLGASGAAALVAGLVYSLGGFFASQTQHMGSMMAAAWLPLAWEGAWRRSSGLVITAVVMSTLAGFTPMTLVVIASTLAWSWRAAPAIATAAALAALQLGPAHDLLVESVARFRTDWLGSGGGLPPRALASLVHPNAHGIFDLDTYRQPYELTHLYVFCGWLALGLALLSGARRQPRLALYTGLFALAMLGEYTPAGKVLFALLPSILQPSFYWYPFLAPFTLCVALLAAEALMAERIRPHAAIAAVVIAAELIVVGSGRPMNQQSLAREPGISESQIDGSEETLAVARRLAGDGRIDTMNDSMLWSSGAPLARLRAANGYDPMALDKVIGVRRRMVADGGARWGAYYQIDKPNHAALRSMAVSVIVTRERMAAPPEHLELAGTAPGRYFYRVREATPRLTVAPGRVLAVNDGRNRIHVRLRLDGPGELVLRDAWSFAWRASIDGKAAPIAVHEGAFRRISIATAGEHEVVMEIDRWRFWRWSLVSFATACGLIAVRMRTNGAR